MKLIFAFCLSLITLTAFSQTAAPIGQYSKLYEFKNGVRVDSAFFAPRRDTFTSDATMKAPGMLLYNMSDSLMYYRNSFKWKPLFSTGAVPTLYTSDGEILENRTVLSDQAHSIVWQDFNSYEINEADGSGSLASYGFYPGSFQFVWNPAGEPTSSLNYNSNAYSVSLQTNAGYIVNTQENAQIGLGYSIYEKATGGLTSNEKIELQQGFTADSNIWTIRHYKTNVTQPELLVAVDSFGTVKLKKYPNNAAQDSAISTDAFGRVKMKYVGNVAALWDSTKIKDSVILNRLFPLQAANYYINGSGSERRHTVFNTDTASYVPYYVFGHAGGGDTTKQSWSVGLQGVGGGGPGFAGNVLTWRSYTTAGAFLGDRMTLNRGGTLTTVNLVAGFTGFTGVLGSNVIRAVGDIGATGDLNVNGAVNHRSRLVESGTITITGDYTVLPTDLYINVNNTANCTVTIPVANATAGLDGRVLHIKKTINNAFTITIVVSGGTQTIDAAANLVMSAFMDAKTLHDDGANWFIY